VKAPLKVAIDVTPILGNRTGVGNVVNSLVAGLATRPELDVTGVVVSYSGRSNLAEKLPEGVKPLHVKFPARIAHIMWLKMDRPAISGFDVVHGPNYVVPPCPKASEIVTIHDLTAWRYPRLLNHDNQQFGDLVARAIGRGAHIHAVSNFVGNEVHEYLDIEEDRIHVIPNGYDPSLIGDKSAGKKIVGNDYVLAVGTIEPRKDYPSLVRAMKEVWEIYPEIKLVVAGSDGWGVESFNSAVAECNATDKIIRLGYITEKAKVDLLAGAELLAYPSLYEGFGLPILEAMANETPVVATQVGAIPEVAGDAAVLVPAKSSNALAAAMLDVLEKPDVREHLKEAGLHRVKNYSWENSIDQMLNLYQKIA